MKQRAKIVGPQRQRGIIVVATTISMLALLLVAGYSLNSGHHLLNKTRIQNVIDSSALNAAKMLDNTGDVVASEQAAIDILTTNLALAGYQELAKGISDQSISVVVEFSDLLDPFIDGGANPRFVRVTLSDDVPLQNVFMTYNKVVNASAVSGPSPTLDASACDLVPLIACGENTLECDEATGECSNYYGYEPNSINIMKLAAGDDSEVGNGNFYLLDLPGGSGGSSIRQYMAGGYDECIALDDAAETKPGNTVGPVVQGLNMRLGEGGGGGLSSDEYQADFDSEYGDMITVNEDGSLNIPDDIHEYTAYNANYTATYAASCPGDGQCYRRMLSVAIGQCDGTVNGQGTVPLYGFGCFYMMQPVVQKGNEAHIFGQFVAGCNNDGSFSEDPGTGPAPTRIILYKDPDKVDA